MKTETVIIRATPDELSRQQRDFDEKISVAPPSESERPKKWWPDLFLKKGRTLQLITAEQCAPLRMAYNAGRGASEIRREMDLFSIDGEKIGYVSYNGRIWLRDIEGSIEVII